MIDNEKALGQQMLLFSDDEEWRDIVGYEGEYQVSDKGRVRSFKYRNKHGIYILKLQPNKKGYYIVGLTKNCHRRTAVVHRLVANAFIPNPDNLPQINHKDEVKTNNNVDNLEWCTNAYNSAYGTHNERVGLSNTGKKRTPESIENYKKCQDKRRDKYAYGVLQYDLNGILIREWRCSFDIEKELGIPRANVRDCCRKKTKTCGGYIWRYKSDESAPVIHQVNNENLRPVLQYDLNAKFINEFPSINDAWRKTGISASHIGGCCRGKSKSAGGYLWRFKNDMSAVAIYQSRNGKGSSHHSAKVVLQYTISGELIKEWGCVCEAANELGISRSYICVCCKKKNKTAGGFRWRYKNEIDNENKTS